MASLRPTEEALTFTPNTQNTPESAVVMPSARTPPPIRFRSGRTQSASAKRSAAVSSAAAFSVLASAAIRNGAISTGLNDQAK